MRARNRSSSWFRAWSAMAGFESLIERNNGPIVRSDMGQLLFSEKGYGSVSDCIQVPTKAYTCAVRSASNMEHSDGRGRADGTPVI